MNTTMGWVLAGGLAVWISAALWAAGVPKGLRPWLKKPKNEALALQIIVGVIACLFAIVAWLSDSDSWLGSFQTEATGIAIAVVIIEIVSQRRSHLDRKQSIIQQLASHSNDFALDVARICRDEGWQMDGSLQGAILWSAHLENANLRGAHLEGADLRDAHLQGTILQDATYNDATKWPDGFDPQAAGARLTNT